MKKRRDKQASIEAATTARAPVTRWWWLRENTPWSLSWAIWSARCATTGCHSFASGVFCVFSTFLYNKEKQERNSLYCCCLTKRLACVLKLLCLVAFYVGPSKVLPESRVFSWDRRDTLQEQDYVKREVIARDTRRHQSKHEVSNRNQKKNLYPGFPRHFFFLSIICFSFFFLTKLVLNDSFSAGEKAVVTPAPCNNPFSPVTFEFSRVCVSGGVYIICHQRTRPSCHLFTRNYLLDGRWSCMGWAAANWIRAIFRLVLLSKLSL